MDLNVLSLTSAVSRVKACKIDPDCTYICPCRKQGELCPIALTEALGCSQCHHIFVVRADGYLLEQLSHIYPYKQVWYWTGKDWTPVRPPLYRRGFVWILGTLTLLFLGLLSLPLLFQVPLDRRVMVWMVLTIIMALALSFMVWLTMYRAS